jgi:hypothetical protein
MTKKTNNSSRFKLITFFLIKLLFFMNENLKIMNHEVLQKTLNTKNK